MSSEPTPRHDKPDAWLDLADRVSTGEEIDFAALEAEINDPAARDLLRAFATLSSIGQLHSRHHLAASRTLTPGSPEPAERPWESSEDEGERWGDLILRESVGRGANGEVYRAHDPRLERDVALKLLHPHRAADRDWADAMLREGRALARVDHPNVIRVHGAAEHGGRSGLWMEFVQGRDLETFLREHGRLSGEEAALLGRKVARALSAVHAAGIVHRDIKAQNLMRAEGGRIVLMDFGSSRGNLSDDTGPVTGTPLYMAPELFEGQPATVASDLYAVGVLLFHLVTGRFPVHASTFGGLREAHARGRRTSLLELRDDLPRDFVDAVDCALARDPAERFTTAAQMAEALDSGRGARALARPPRPSWSRLRRWPVALVASLLVAFAIWSHFANRPSLPPPGGSAISSEFHVDAALLRYRSNSTEELFSGAALELRQQLGLRFDADAPVHLYVIDQDAAGQSYVLFPLRGGELQNPLPPGRHELPGRVDGQDRSWTVTSEGGQEQILLVASRHALGDLETRLATIAQAGDAGPYVPLDDSTLQSLRGIGGLSPRVDAPGRVAESASLLDEIQELAGGPSRADPQTSRDGVWIRRIILHGGR